MILNRRLTVLGVSAVALGLTAAAGPAFASAGTTAHANPGGLFHAAPGVHAKPRAVPPPATSPSWTTRPTGPATP